MAHDKRERVADVSPQAESCQLERDPERTREEPHRCPNMTGSGVHGKRLVPNVRFGNNMCAVTKQAGRTREMSKSK